MPSPRRQFLHSLLALPAALPVDHARTASRGGHYLACCRDRTGAHHLACIDWQRGSLELVPLPARGHQVAATPASPWCAAPARRPGDWMLLWQRRSGERRVLKAPRGHHFYGHAVFDAEGRRLFATTQHADSGRGAVTAFDAARGFAVLAHHASHGTGPHAIALDPLHRQLVVCNGGQRTHPANGRRLLNPDSVRSSLVRLTLDGQLIGRQPAPLPGMSWRHLDLDPQGRAVVAAQIPDAVSVDHTAALLWTESEIGGPLRPTAWHSELQAQLHRYLGDVAWHGEELIASSPPSNQLLRVGDSVQPQSRSDVAGIAGGTARAAISDGRGRLTVLGDRTRRFAVAFDNHLTRLFA